MRSDLLNSAICQLAQSGRNWNGDVDQAEKAAIREIVDLKVDASVIANGDFETRMSIQTIAILPEVHAIAEREYRREVRRGIEKSAAKAMALDVVRHEVVRIIQRYKHQQDIDNEPQNVERRNRLERWNEVRDASYIVSAIPGGPVAADHAELQDVLARIDSQFSESIMDICASPSNEGITFQLIVSQTQETGYVITTHRLFTRSDDGIERAYFTGGSEYPIESNANPIAQL